MDFLFFFKNEPHHFPLIAFDPRSHAPRYPLLCGHRFVVIAFVNHSLVYERSILSRSVCGGTGGRDALRKRHSAAFLAKAREEPAPSDRNPPPSFATFLRRKVDKKPKRVRSLPRVIALGMLSFCCTKQLGWYGRITKEGGKASPTLG